MDQPTHARLRMFALCKPYLRLTDPVADADNRTSMDDARAALCIANGIPIDELDPVSGHDLTRAAYETARTSWRRHVEVHGFHEFYDRPRYERAFGYWVARRPQFTDGDDWLAGLVKPFDATEGA